MAKKCCLIQFSLVFSFLTMGGCLLFAQETPSETSQVQTQVISIGILEFRDESEANVEQFARRVTQQLRQKILVTSQDLLPKIMQVDAAAAEPAGMSVGELADLGRQFGVKLIVRGGILPITVETANGETKAIVRLYVDLVSIDSGVINTIRVEGSDAQPGSFPDLAGSDADSPDFANCPVGQALSRAIERLSEVIREQAVSLTAVPQEPPTAESAEPAETLMAAEEAAAPVDPAAQAAEEDLELQQLIADAQAALNAGVGADPQLLDQVSQGLANLQSNLAVKADLLQRGESTEQVEQDLAQCKTELRVAIDTVMQSQPVAESGGYPAGGESGRTADMLNQANGYASEAIDLIQKIKDVRAMLWGAHEETQVVNQDEYADMSEQVSDQLAEEPLEEVTGVVIDDGQPVEGVEVVDSESGATTTTGPDGQYTLPVQPGILSNIAVKRQGLVLASNRVHIVKGGANVSDFVLTKSASGAAAGAISSTSLGGAARGAGGMIKGIVTTPEGKPAAQVLVSSPGVGTVRSSSTGQFMFVNVPAGTHALSVQQPGIEPQTIQVQVVPKTTATATLRLATAGFVRPTTATRLITAGSGSAVYGQVKDNQKQSVIGARVTAIRGGSTVSVATGREGRYELKDLSPGAYQIRLSKPGFRSTQATVNLRSNKKEKRDFEMQILSPVLGQLRKLEESKSGTVKGKIRGPDNRPVAGATVEAIPIGQQLRPAKTQANSGGEFKLSLREGRYQINVRRTSFRSEARSVLVQAGKSTQENFALTKAPAVTPVQAKTIPSGAALGKPQSKQATKPVTLGGVQTPTAAPVPGRIIGRATDSRTHRPVSGAEVFVQGRRSGQTDTGGNYSVDNLPPGNYRVGIREAGYINQERVIQVRTGAASRVDFELAPVAASPKPAVKPVAPLAVPSQPSGQIEGRVLDSKTGRAISGAAVTLSGVGSTATDSAGRYRILNLKPNSYRISVGRSGYQGQQRTVKVDSGRRVTADFSLNPVVAAPRVLIPRKK